VDRFAPRRENILADGIAGFTFAAVNVPQAMANAVLANVNPLAGLYTLIIATPLAALLTGSVYMNVSTTNALSVVAGSAVADMPVQDRLSTVATLTLLAGALQLAFGLLRMGWLLRFVPYSVLTGFLNGVAVIIILSQLGDLTGFRGAGPNRLLQALDTLRHVQQIRLTTLAVGLSTIALIVLLLRTRLKQMAMLVALVVVTVAVSILEPRSVVLVGDVVKISRSLPHPGLPSLALSLEIVTGAAAIAVVGLVQAAGVSKGYPNPDGRYPNVSHDFLGQGVANMATSLFQGIPAGGSISGTALTVSAGARSRWTNILAGIFVAVIVVALAPLVELVPMAALAGLMVVVGFASLRIPQAITVVQTGPVSAAAMVLTFGATLVIPLQYAVMFGIGVAVVLNLVQQSNRIRIVRIVFDEEGRPVEERAPDRLPGNQATLLMVLGSLDFASAGALEGILPGAEGTRHAVAILTLRGRLEVGSTFIDVLRRYADALRASEGKLMLSGVGPELLYQLERTGTLALLGRDNVFPAQKHFFASSQMALSEANAWLVRPD
jgi:SulP family sulfate permease